MAATDAQAFPFKNRAARFYAVILSTTTGNALTGGLTGLAAWISKDGGAFAATATFVGEVGTSGYVIVDLPAAEMNCDCMILEVRATNTGAKYCTIFVYPVHTTFLKANGPTRFEHWLKIAKAFCWNLQRKNNNLLTIFDDDDVTELGQGTVAKAASITDRGRYQ